MTDIAPPRSIVDADRPPFAPGSLSRGQRDRLIERGILGLYRWYTSRSQATRNWSPDSSFPWREIRRDFSEPVRVMLEGFFAVEQYVPDYTSKALDLVRRSHGRSHFQLRWGSEEEKHADTWENAVLFSRSRTAEQLAEYKYNLREKVWMLPWEDPLHVLVYTVFQERATQLNYINLGKIAAGLSDKPYLQNDADPILARVAHTIAVDEAAHYNFFLESMRLHLYYFPLETLEAIRDVLQYFAMPASGIVPNWQEFFETVYKAGVYGPREYSRDVIAVVFKNLGIETRRALEDGIRRTRLVPDLDGSGDLRGSAIWESFDPSMVENDVKRLYDKIVAYERGIGFDEVDPFSFQPNPHWPRSGETGEAND